MREATGGRSYSRRGVLRATAGTAAAAALGSAATGSATGQADFDGWFTDDAPGGTTDNYDGETVDRTGEDEVTVTVGADGNGGTFAFEPAAVRISPGTTVTFDWVSDTHNVLIESQPDDANWGGHQPIENTGFSFSTTFDTRGVYKYYCEPHLSLGMKGAIVVAEGDGEQEDTVPAEYGDWFTGDAPGGAVDNYGGETVDRTGADEVTVTVGADGNGGTFAFDPPALRVSPGTTVTFEWVSDTHNVFVESQPEGAAWEGHQPIENTGFSFSSTFDTRGVYKYYCEPHLSVGMKAAIVVGPAPAADGEAAPSGTTTPFSPMLGWVFAGAVTAAMLLPVLAGYYRRDQPETPEYEADAEEAPDTGRQEAPVEEPVEELDHDEYDPRGTAAIVTVYFLILIAMWVFMYFVEFLGNELTVIG